MKKNLTLGGYSVYLKTALYSNGRIALQAIAAKDDPKEAILKDYTEIAAVTANLVYEEIPDKHYVFIDTNNLSGIVQILIDAKIIEKPIKYCQSGFVKFPLCKLTDDFITEYKL